MKQCITHTAHSDSITAGNLVSIDWCEVYMFLLSFKLVSFCSPKWIYEATISYNCAVR